VPQMDTLHIRTDRRRRRWRRLNTMISGGIGILAIGGAVSLGLGAPSTSPVVPAAAAAAPQVAAGTAGSGASADVADDRGDGGRGRGARAGMIGFDRPHR
jgi:hypothetical protein